MLMLQFCPETSCRLTSTSPLMDYGARVQFSGAVSFEVTSCDLWYLAILGDKGCG